MSLQARETKIGEDSRSGPIGEWEVAERYGVQEGLIVPGGQLGRRRFYYPVYHPELAPQLAKVEDEATALTFVQEWGLLGFNRLHDEWHRGQTTLDRYGDPLDWIRTHASAVGTLLKLIAIRREWEPEDAITVYLNTVLEANQGGIPLGQGYRSGVWEINVRFVEERPIEAATAVVKQLINPNVHYLQPALIEDADHPGQLVRRYTFGALLPVIYGHLMEAAEGRRHFYQCEYRHCGIWWPVDEEQRGPRRRYCPTDAGESRCSRSERYYREKEGMPK